MRHTKMPHQGLTLHIPEAGGLVWVVDGQTDGSNVLQSLCRTAEKVVVRGQGQQVILQHAELLGTVLGDEEELSEGTVQGKEDAGLCHVLKQAVLHVGKELPQGLQQRKVTQVTVAAASHNPQK